MCDNNYSKKLWSVFFAPWLRGGGLLPCLMCSDMLPIAHSVQHKKCFFINLKGGEMKLFSSPLWQFVVLRNFLYRLSCKCSVCCRESVSVGCSAHVNCRRIVIYFFLLFLFFLAIEKHPERERSFQCSVVFSPVLGLCAIVFYFSKGLDKFQSVIGTERKTIALGINSPNKFKISSFNSYCA